MCRRSDVTSDHIWPAHLLAVLTNDVASAFSQDQRPNSVGKRADRPENGPAHQGVIPLRLGQSHHLPIDELIKGPVLVRQLVTLEHALKVGRLEQRLHDYHG